MKVLYHSSARCWYNNGIPWTLVGARAHLTEDLINLLKHPGKATTT